MISVSHSAMSVVQMRAVTSYLLFDPYHVSTDINRSCPLELPSVRHVPGESLSTFMFEKVLTWH